MKRILIGCVTVGLSSLLMSGSVLAAGSHVGPPWLTTNKSKKIANLTLVGAYNSAAGGFNFDGYDKGKMTVTVPVGWTVDVVCMTSNKSKISHSCAITKSVTSTKPAFKGAESAKATTGFTPGKSGSFHFKPNKTGTYKIVCLVPGHASAGMWDTFKVVSKGTPSIKLSK